MRLRSRIHAPAKGAWWDEHGTPKRGMVGAAEIRLFGLRVP